MRHREGNRGRRRDARGGISHTAFVQSGAGRASASGSRFSSSNPLARFASLSSLSLPLLSPRLLYLEQLRVKVLPDVLERRQRPVGGPVGADVEGGGGRRRRSARRSGEDGGGGASGGPVGAGEGRGAQGRAAEGRRHLFGGVFFVVVGVERLGG